MGLSQYIILIHKQYIGFKSICHIDSHQYIGFKSIYHIDAHQNAAMLTYAWQVAAGGVAGLVNPLASGYAVPNDLTRVWSTSKAKDSDD